MEDLDQISGLGECFSQPNHLEARPKSRIISLFKRPERRNEKPDLIPDSPNSNLHMVIEVLWSAGRCRRDGSLDVLHIAGDDLVRSHAELGLVAGRLVRIRFVACICWVRLVKHNVAIVVHLVHGLAIAGHIW